MDARRESEPTPMENRTTVERKSERELVVTRTFDGPARIVFEAWTKPKADQAVVGTEVGRHVPAFLRGGCSCRGQRTVSCSATRPQSLWCSSVGTSK